MGSKKDILHGMVLCGLCILVLAGCGAKKEDVLAKVDNTVITVQDFKERIAGLPERYREVVTENKKRFLNEIIVDELLYREALREGMHKDKEVRNVIEAAKKKILIAKLLQDKIDNVVNVDDDEIKTYYNAHPEEFKTPEILRASHILVKGEEEAKAILLELANNRNFEDLARARSIDPTSERGGDIGYFTRGQLDPDFEKVCFELKEGEISGVVKTRFGYHIIKLTERKPSSIADYKDVKDRIKQQLLKNKKRAAFNNLVEHLKDRARIVINEHANLLTESSKDE